MLIKVLGKILLYCTLMAFSWFAIAPIVWTFISSVQNRIDIISTPPVLIFTPTTSNYKKLIETFPEFPQHLINTVVTSTVSTAVVLLISLLAAYGVSRFRFWWRGPFLVGILINRMLPEVSLCIPFYLIAKSIGLYDTLTIVILGMIAITSPFAVWLLMGFVEKIPRELEESAMVDGCSHLNAFIRITLPLMVPGLFVTSLFCFLFCWNLFLLPLLLTCTKALTLTILVAKCSTEFGIEWGPLTALTTILFLPLLALGAFIQKYLVSGLTLGAIKE